MLPDGRRIGPHVALGHGMVRAADRAREIGASAIQVFSDNPTAWRRRETLPAELPAFRARLADHGLAPLAIHAPYLVNLAGADPVFHERSVTVLAHDLEVAAAYGAAFLNVHVGSHGGDGPDAGIRRLAAGVAVALAAAPAASSVALVLENGAGGGHGLGVTLEELAAIADALGLAGVPEDRVAFCLDTAHLWGAGYRLDDPAVVDEVVDRFDALLGLGRLRMVHLNDSRAEPGSRTDRHEHVGAGRIGARGLARVLTHPGLAHVAYYLETPGMDEGWDGVNLARALALAVGDPLGDLPPEAFTTRSSRGRSAPVEDADDAPAAS